MSSRLITVKELLQAPTGFDWSTIAEDAAAADPEQFVEQTNIIDRACAWAAGHTSQSSGLQSTTDVETARLGGPSTRAWVDRDGWLWIRTALFPILSVSKLEWAVAASGQSSLTWNTVTSTAQVIYGEGYRLTRVADLSQDWTWLRYSPGLVRLTYVNGWPNTYFTSQTPVAGNSVQLTVESTLGMSATSGAIGNTLTIYDGANTEVVTVTSVDTATQFHVASLAHQHEAAVGVSAVPSDIKEAVILACTFFARQRGTEAWEMGSGGGAPAPRFGGYDEDLVTAEALLEPFRVHHI